jgi:hypothetical protein
MNRNLRL